MKRKPESKGGVHVHVKENADLCPLSGLRVEIVKKVFQLTALT
jgi:hypothetical protein